MTASVRLAAFIFPQYAAMMQTDEMDLTSLGERKRAIFCVIPVNDGSMNYLVSMLFTQCFQQLYLRADERYNGRLPIPVRVIQDEWANVAQPDSYPKVLATCRSYNIGINIIVQNIQSIKALYKDEWEGIEIQLLLCMDAGSVFEDDGIRYYMNSREAGKHNEPHVHVDIRHETSGSFSIITGKKLSKGKIKTSDVRKIQMMIANHQAELINFWNEHTDGLTVDLDQAFGLIGY